MQVPSIGRMIVYRANTLSYGTVEVPAVITHVYANGEIDLQLFGQEYEDAPYRNQVREGTEAYQWSWPVIQRPPAGRQRGFEFVDEKHRAIPDKALKLDGIERKLPTRATKNSAAYDIYSLETGTVAPGRTYKFETDIKAYMLPDEVLIALPRSSQGIKLDLMLANTAGVIDSDFYGNVDNDGNIGIFLRNLGKQPVTIEAGERVAQVMFVKYLKADDDDEATLPTRAGGIGHSGK